MRQALNKLNLFFPQWQGGGPDPAAYYGAHELKENYCSNISFAEVEVNRDEKGPAGQKIYEFKQILAQTEAAWKVISDYKPGRIFTIGGGCDAGILPAAHLNDLLEGDLSLLWLDAHGDLNTPQSSLSGYLYGMPVRTLMGEGEPALLNFINKPFVADQLVMAGLRDLDQAEQEFLAQKKIRVLSVDSLMGKPSLIGEALNEKGSRNLYIHLDLDVLDPDEFPHVPVAAPGGLAFSVLSAIIDDLASTFNFCGFGIFEYSASGKGDIELLRRLCEVGAAL